MYVIQLQTASKKIQAERILKNKVTYRTFSHVSDRWSEPLRGTDMYTSIRTDIFEVLVSVFDSIILEAIRQDLYFQ